MSPEVCQTRGGSHENEAHGRAPGGMAPFSLLRLLGADRRDVQRGASLPEHARG